jgi:hypothetical protein
VGEETRTFSRQTFEKETGLGLTTHKALELPHQPSLERLVDVAQDWAQGLVVISSVVFDPTAKDRIYLLGDVSHRHMGSSSNVQVPDRRSHGLQRRRADRREKAAEHQSIPRVFCRSGPEAVAEVVKRDVRVSALSVAVLATIDDSTLGGVQLQAAFREAGPEG